MTEPPSFTSRLEAKVVEQLRAQRVGYLFGAGASYLDGNGYPLSFQLWDRIKDAIEASKRAEIQAKLDAGAQGLENALDLLDNGLPSESPHRHLVTSAIADLFAPLNPPLDAHSRFLTRLNGKSVSAIRVFTLNYDPLIERAAEAVKVRVCDGFCGNEHAFFDQSVFDERIGQIRGTHKGRQFQETVRPIHLLKLHGSLGWYETDASIQRRAHYSLPIPPLSKRLMIPPQRRKANDTMTPPYSALWSVFRGTLGQSSVPVNRLACFGYGFLDEHVNAVIDGALARPDFTLLIFAKNLTDAAWNRWSPKTNVIVITENRCAIKGEIGPGHQNLWDFSRLSNEV